MWGSGVARCATIEKFVILLPNIITMYLINMTHFIKLGIRLVMRCTQLSLNNFI